MPAKPQKEVVLLFVYPSRLQPGTMHSTFNGDVAVVNADTSRIQQLYLAIDRSKFSPGRAGKDANGLADRKLTLSFPDTHTFADVVRKEKITGITVFTSKEAAESSIRTITKFQLVSGGFASVEEIGGVRNILAGMNARTSGGWALQELAERCANPSSKMDAALEAKLIKTGILADNGQLVDNTTMLIASSLIDTKIPGAATLRSATKGGGVDFPVREVPTEISDSKAETLLRSAAAALAKV